MPYIYYTISKVLGRTKYVLLCFTWCSKSSGDLSLNCAWRLNTSGVFACWKGPDNPRPQLAIGLSVSICGSWSVSHEVGTLPLLLACWPTKHTDPYSQSMTESEVNQCIRWEKEKEGKAPPSCCWRIHNFICLEQFPLISYLHHFPDPICNLYFLNMKVNKMLLSHDNSLYIHSPESLSYSFMWTKTTATWWWYFF